VTQKHWIKSIAIIGSGTMGSQIAARLAGEHITILLFDMPTEAEKNGRAKQALAQLTKLHPKPLAHPSHLDWIEPKSILDDLEDIRSCDWVIEAIYEDFEAKKNCYQSIAPYINNSCILTSNTSGLSITQLAETLPESLKPRFFGLHWFNPPRYLPLIELITHPYVDKAAVIKTATWLENTLGKSVLYAKDCPGFIANRFGCMALLLACIHGEHHKLDLATIDAITGTLIGHPKSATFRTLDWVGLDIFQSVLNTLATDAKKDPWSSYYTTPGFIQSLIDKGYLGQKTKQGIYCKTVSEIKVWSVQKKNYQEKTPLTRDFKRLKKRWLHDPLGCLTAPENNAVSLFLSDWFRDFWHYTAHHAARCAASPSDIDLAMRSGFQWQEGPFESWQKMGWQPIKSWINNAIDEGKTIVNTPLPEWTNATEEQGAYAQGKTFNFEQSQYIMPNRDERIKDFPLGTVVLLDHDTIRLWHQEDGVLIASLKTKMHTLNPAVLSALENALHIASQDYKALVIFPMHGQPFSAGADIKSLAIAYLLGGSWKLKRILKQFQNTFALIQQSPIPCVAAVDGYALGGGCELMMHCHQTVATLNSIIGLVEPAIGLIPGAGGLTIMAQRAAMQNNPDALQQYFEQIAQAKIAESAYEAMDMGYLTAHDRIIHNPHLLLDSAKSCALSLAQTGVHNLIPRSINVAGKDQKALCLAKIHLQHTGHFASDHDALVATHLAHVLTGGDLQAGSLVNPSWYRSLERDAFIALCQTKATRERIKHMAKTGKPLRN
jgi:3-hydroxyacyl-CoA dehydrogenase